MRQALRRRHSMWCAALAVGALVVAGCGGSDSASGERSANAGCDTSETAPGITKDQITLGATLPMTGSGSGPANDTVVGSKAYYAMVNKAGGVKGRKIKWIALDDQYNPSVALQQYRTLVQREKIFAVAGEQGTPNFLAGLPFLESQKIPAIAPWAPTSELGNMEHPHVFTTVVDYRTEFELMAKYVLEHHKPKTVSLVGVQGNVGDDARAGMKAGFGNAVKLQYIPEQPGTPDLGPIARQMQAHGSEWVFMILTAADTGALLRAMNQIGYKPRLASYGAMMDEKFINSFASLAQDMLIAQEVALPDSRDPQVRKMAADFKRQTGRPPTIWNEVGWLQAMVTVRALQNAPALTRSCLVTGLEKIRNWSTGIVPPITFGPNRRNGVRAVGFVQIKGSGLKQIVPFKAI